MEIPAARSASRCSALVVVAGYAGSERRCSNIAPTFVFITFWVGLVFASALFGDVFRALSPWRAIGRVTAGSAPRRAARGPRLAYPERLGRWPAAAGLLAFTWVELVSGLGRGAARARDRDPRSTPSSRSPAQAVYGVETLDAPRRAVLRLLRPLLPHLASCETRERVVGVRPPLLGGLPRLDAYRARSRSSR